MTPDDAVDAIARIEAQRVHWIAQTEENARTRMRGVLQAMEDAGVEKGFRKGIGMAASLVTAETGPITKGLTEKILALVPPKYKTPSEVMP